MHKPGSYRKNLLVDSYTPARVRAFGCYTPWGRQHAYSASVPACCTSAALGWANAGDAQEVRLSPANILLVALRAMGWQWARTAEVPALFFERRKRKRCTGCTSGPSGILRIARSPRMDGSGLGKEKAAPQSAAPGPPVLRGTPHILWVAGEACRSGVYEKHQAILVNVRPFFFNRRRYSFIFWSCSFWSR